MGSACSCFDGEAKQQKIEQDRLASAEARAKASEAAQKRQQEFDQSAIGRAFRAQTAKEKQSVNTNKGGPGLKWQIG